MNAFVTWQERWNTGIAEIDKQHAEMADQLNLIAATVNLVAHEEEERNHTLNHLLDDFINTTREHFNYEESQMQYHGYPGYASHKREHVMLTAELAQLAFELKQDKALDIDTLRSLKHWLVAHITVADREFAGYLHSLE
jgi:hemerythrin